MHISNDRYFLDRERHDLALRMIRHEARTCTIRSCTGLTDDRIRRLYKTYASHTLATPIRRRRGKSPRQPSYFVRNVRAQYESSLLASTFSSFGLLLAQGEPAPEPIQFGRLFCDAFETHRQLVSNAHISFEHAWFLLQLLAQHAGLRATRCRRCDSLYLRDAMHAVRRTCPVCKLKGRTLKRFAEARPAASQSIERPNSPTGVSSAVNIRPAPSPA
ncbi:MAG: FlhC family transcriptional regulator [Steroidobacter sp.]